MDKKYRIVIIEDQLLLRAGLRALLLQEPDLEIAGETQTGPQAESMIVALLPDLVLMDPTVPGGISGIAAIAQIKQRLPGIKILILTLQRADEYIQLSLRAGADGYILKDATGDELRVAIRSVLQGKTYLSPDISNTVINGYLGSRRVSGITSAWETVTHRERQVLKLVAEGRANKSIADYLSLSVKTVEKHRSNLMKKLNLHNASTLTAFAIAKGLMNNDASAPSQAPIQAASNNLQ
jgi:DNA-binding NarL/FixJ family response regulator